MEKKTNWLRTSLIFAAASAVIVGGLIYAEELASPAVAQEQPLTLPVSLNAVMVGLIDHSSDPIFYAGNPNRLPQSEDEWRELEYHAYQMVVGGKVIQLAGTGPMDADWVSQPEWINYSEQLTAVGMEALNAAQARDLTNYFEIGSRLVAACEGCHEAYKPDIPSMGIMHPPDFPR
jgi:hypothetical protein